MGLISGRRFHFAGKAAASVDPSRLAYVQTLVRHLAHQILAQGGGLVVTVGSEPMHKSKPDLPLIFDWTALEALNDYQISGKTNWPMSQGAPVIAVGLSHWRERMPENRKNLWNKVVSSKNLEIVQIKPELSVGGVLRRQQATFGDILVCIGGSLGVEHLAELYLLDQKPAIPIDIQLDPERRSASERLAELAMENPQAFFKHDSARNSAAAYSRLSLRHEGQDIEEFERRFFDFVSHLQNPKAFFVRLLNPKISEFKEVERFFRNVVDPVVRDSGYERFEVGTDASTEAFLNVEIFKSMHSSSLVIADLTGLRLNCFSELGYALGLGKRLIITAQEGTCLPFDTASLPCHFWSPNLADDVRRESFWEFMRKNINRRSIVS